MIQTKRYPIRGALYGLLLGLGAAYLAFFQFAMFGFDSLSGVLTKFVIIIVLGMVVGVVWAFVAPARKPKDPAPVADEPPPAVVDDEPPPAVDEVAAEAMDEAPDAPDDI